MRYLDTNGLKYLLKQLQNNLQIQENKYSFVVEKKEIVSFSIPNFVVGDKVDLFVNRLILEPEQDYTLSNKGLVVFKKELETNDRVYVVVSKIKIRGVE